MHTDNIYRQLNAPQGLYCSRTRLERLKHGHSVSEVQFSPQPLAVLGFRSLNKRICVTSKKQPFKQVVRVLSRFETPWINHICSSFNNHLPRRTVYDQGIKMTACKTHPNESSTNAVGPISQPIEKMH